MIGPNGLPHRPVHRRTTPALRTSRRGCVLCAPRRCVHTPPLIPCRRTPLHLLQLQCTTSTVQTQGCKLWSMQTYHSHVAPPLLGRCRSLHGGTPSGRMGTLQCVHQWRGASGWPRFWHRICGHLLHTQPQQCCPQKRSTRLHCNIAGFSLQQSPLCP